MADYDVGLVYRPFTCSKLNAGCSADDETETSEAVADHLTFCASGLTYNLSP